MPHLPLSTNPKFNKFAIIIEIKLPHHQFILPFGTFCRANVAVAAS